MVGDIVGNPGRGAFLRIGEQLRKDRDLDLVLANGENAAGGRGPTPEIAAALFEAGADLISLGDHSWDSRKMVKYIDIEPRILRPANFPPGTPGRGWKTLETEEGTICMVSLIGRTFMGPADCPFRTIDSILKKPALSQTTVLVDFHAEATSEKIAMGHYLAGRVGLIAGTHTHVQTSDERILPGGTAYITDLGMTGPRESVIGREIKPVVERFKTGLPQRFNVAKNNPCLEGIIVELDLKKGQALNIERLRIEG